MRIRVVLAEDMTEDVRDKLLIAELMWMAGEQGLTADIHTYRCELIGVDEDGCLVYVAEIGVSR